MKEVSITKLDLTTKTLRKTTDFVAEEKPLHLFVNNTYWATILCSPADLKEMAVGHLLSEGVLKSTAEIDDVILKEAENSCYVKLKTEVKVEDRIKLSRLHARVVTSACGSGSPYQYARRPAKVKSELTVKAEVLFNSVNQLNFKAELFRKTGGVHAAAIYKADGALVAMAEDVGRHNAVDKVIGMAALNQTDFSRCFLALSGRLSGDVVFKASKVGLPIIGSLAAALSSGIEMAEQANLTLAGFVRGKRMNIYTFDERISP
ncbi:MAG TPA: formate dehydrogenase accessory sulfurtransferase FdhD [Candidatus Bathyarchaeia archaeon]|nr:formate dehydrogenase accessory sulfurtransferase FdhD [Candidatus Bathyarchaeia archaeon]